YGQLGDGSTTPRTSAVAAGATSGIASISDGADVDLALPANGQPLAAGNGGEGQLGNGGTANSSSYTACSAMGTNRIVQVAAGPDHGVALDSSGKVWTWGNNGFGQLGRSTAAGSPPPSVR